MTGSVFSSAYAAPAAKSAVEYATSSATPIALANGVQFYLGTGATALYKVDC